MLKTLGLLALLLSPLPSLKAETPSPLLLQLRETDIAHASPEIETKGGGVAHISVPAIAVHLPEPAAATGLAVVVCPGGSYREVGGFANGMRAVPYFVPKGAAVIVLKYRTRPPSTNVINDALEDAKRAVRLVRHHAGSWGIDPQKIGMIGSSAGSHLILNLATHSDPGNPAAHDPVERESCRPDFMALLCPWPNRQPITDFPITSKTPPAFVACAEDDQVAHVAFSAAIVEACQKAGVPATFWRIPSGGHTAFKQVKNPAYQWPEKVTQWLEEIDLAPAGSSLERQPPASQGIQRD